MYHHCRTLCVKDVLIVEEYYLRVGLRDIMESTLVARRRYRIVSLIPVTRNVFPDLQSVEIVTAVSVRSICSM